MNNGIGSPRCEDGMGRAKVKKNHSAFKEKFRKCFIMHNAYHIQNETSVKMTFLLSVDSAFMLILCFYYPYMLKRCITDKFFITIATLPF